MYATVRRYVGVPGQLVGALQGDGCDIEEAMRAAPGFVAFDLMRTRDGMIAVIVADDEMSALDVERRAASWMKQHTSGGAPQTWDVIAGDVLVHAGPRADPQANSVP